MRVIHCERCCQRMTYQFQDETGWRYYQCPACGKTWTVEPQTATHHVTPAMAAQQRVELDARFGDLFNDAE